MKRKVSALFLSIVMVSMVFLSACNNGGSSTSSLSSSSTPSSSAPPSSAPLSSSTTAAGSSSSAPASQKQSSSAPTSKILVAYFTVVGNVNFSSNVDVSTHASLRKGANGLVGNTQVIADMVQKRVHGDFFLIQTVNPYPSNYDTLVNQAHQERNDNARPKLKSKVEDMGSYDVVFLGFPCWWVTMPQAVFTFLESYDFSGKTIIPFDTNEGSGFGSAIGDIQKLCPKAKVVTDGLELPDTDVDNAQGTVDNWLKKLGY